MAKRTLPSPKCIADTMPSPAMTAAPSSRYGAKAGSGTARKNVPRTSSGMRPSTGSASSSYSSLIGVLRPVNSGVFGKARALMVDTSGRLVVAVGIAGRASGEPQRQRAHLDAHARRRVRGAGGMVEGDVRHAVRTRGVAVVSLEDERLLGVHVGVPVPAMLRRVREHQALEGPLRLPGRIEHRIGRDEIT